MLVFVLFAIKITQLRRPFDPIAPAALGFIQRTICAREAGVVIALKAAPAPEFAKKQCPKYSSPPMLPKLHNLHRIRSARLPNRLAHRDDHDIAYLRHTFVE